MTRSIVFLSDFGYRNEWVGVCHAVIDRVAPGTAVVDLSHGVPALDVRGGALHVREPHLVEAGLGEADCISVEALSGAAVARRVATFADLEAGEWGLMLDARGWLSVIRGNPANAAEGLGVGSGDLVWLSQPRD